MKKLFILVITSLLAFSSCSKKQETSDKTETIDFASIGKTQTIDFKYALQISIDRYGDYSLITIAGKDSFLLVPEDKSVPKSVPENVTILKQPLDKTYLVSSAVMDLIKTAGAMDSIKFSGTKENDWYIPQAVQAMKEGKIKYAGKYSSPDYELLVKENCTLAIENTMIYHKPAAKEKLEELGIPVLVEHSGYESHPLGRLEWIKLYGILFNKEKEANEYFENKIAEVENIMQSESTGKTVAFFYVTSHGAVNIRKPGDYISKLISLAGGTYIPSHISNEEDNALSTLNMQFEDFYASCLNADIIIYNNNLSDDVKNTEDLINKNSLFADFTAVKTGNVYSAGKQFFQKTTAMTDFLKDIHAVLKGTDGQFESLRKMQ